MRYDFGEVPDLEIQGRIPAGVYDCKVAEVREGLNQRGEVRWSLRLEAVRGPFAGRTLAWDALNWGESGIRDVKHCLVSLGFDVNGEVEIVTSDLVGLRVTANLIEDSVLLQDQGKRRLVVAPAGYTRLLE